MFSLCETAFQAFLWEVQPALRVEEEGGRRAIPHVAVVRLLHGVQSNVTASGSRVVVG